MKRGARRATATGADSEEIGFKDYPRLVPGEYPSYCKWAKKYFDPGFRRWVCLLRFDVFTPSLDEVIACVPMWFSLGDGAKAHASRRGKYLPEWIRANGARPARADRLSPNVFIRRMARIQIGDTEGPLPYSVVKRIVEWDTGERVTKSSCHTVKKGKG